MNRQRVYRLSVLGLVAAGLWQASPAQAQEATSSEFLSAIAGVDIPSTARDQRDAGSATPPAAASQDRALRGLRNENKKLRQRQATLETQLKQLKQRKTETLPSPLPAEQDKAQRELKAAQQSISALQKQVSELTGTRDNLQKRLTQANTGLQQSATSGENAQAQVKTLREENAALKAAAQTQQQTAQKQAAAQTEKSTAAQAQLKMLTAERDELKQQLSGLMKRQGQENKPVGVAPELRTERQKQAYASGVMFAGNLHRTLSLQRDLGADLSAALLIAGLTDGINDKVRLDGQSLQSSYRTLMTQLVSREKEKYREGVKRLEKMTTGATLIKRNGSLFFVQTRKGSGKVASGDRVRFDLTESVVKGKTLRAEKGVDAIMDNKLPYIVEQALTLAGRGGEMTVYCMASDVYPLEQLPEGLFPYSLIQYQFKVAAKPAK